MIKRVIGLLFTLILIINVGYSSYIYSNTKPKLTSNYIVFKNKKFKFSTRGGYVIPTKYIDVRATAYTAKNSYTASGLKACVGHIAVDPKVIPLGTKLYIQSLDGSKDYGYAIAADTGSAIKGNKVDLFFNSNYECNMFGARNVRVYVLGK